MFILLFVFFFFQAEDGIRDGTVTGVQTCALPIWLQEVFDRFPRQGHAPRFRPAMISRPPSFEKLLSFLKTLPSVGPKMSERIAFHILKMPESEIKDLIATIQETYKEVRPCPVCGHWDDSSPCRICSDDSRDKTILCVVENSQDIAAISRVKNFNGT